MLKKYKFLLSLVLAVCLLAQTVFCLASVDDLQGATVEYYKNNKTEISSLWEVGALYGAGVNLNDGTWTFSDLNSGALEADSLPSNFTSHILCNLLMQKDPKTAIEGRNIVDELLLMQNNSTGAFSEMVNQHIWAMIGLDAAQEKYNAEKALQYLGSLKIADGGYSYGATDTSSDTDLTAMALIALSNHKGNSVAEGLISSAVNFLKSVQLENAGFSSWGTENPNTIASVISGLSAVGQDVLSKSWKKGGATMVDALAAYKLANGAYRFSLEEPEVDELATSQALLALDDVKNRKSVWTPDKATVNVRIEGKALTILRGDVTVIKFKPKAQDALEKILNDNSIAFEINNGYISSIKGDAESTSDGYAGWQYMVNSNYPSVGMGSYNINNKDEIILYYGSFAPFTVFPSYKVEPEKLRAGSDIKITVTSNYTEWKDNTEIAVKDAKVVGATIKIGNNEYITDKNGIATISDIYDSGTYKVSISKEQDSYPAIVRVPEFEITVLEKEKESNSSSERRYPVTLPIEVTAEPVAETAVKAEVTPYKDSAEISDWASEEVTKAREIGILTGNDEEKFEPQKNITRAEFTAMLLRLLKSELINDESDYNDIAESDWYYKYILTANKMGLVNGYDDGTFRPDSTITREEMAVIISRAYKFDEASASFDDEEQLSPWAKASVIQVSASGIMVGANGCFTPKENVSREMAAVVAVRLYNRK